MHSSSSYLPLQDIKPRTVGLRWHLWGLVAVTLLPILFIGVIATWLTGKQIRQTALDRLQTTATTLAHAVDQGVEIQLEQLRRGNPIKTQSPHEQASLLHRPTPDWPGNLPPLLHDGQAYWISNVYHQPDSGLTTIAIASRLYDQSEPLVQVLPSRELIRLLSAEQSAQTAGVIALVDSHGYLAARSVDPERWLGKRVPDWDTLTALGAKTGHLLATTQEGMDIIFTFQKLHTAPGWALVVGAPAKQFHASWITPLRGIIAGGLLAFSIALLASHWLARRILHPVRLLAIRSQQIASGSDDPTAPPISGVTEFEQLRISLGEAELALQQRAEDARQMAAQLERNQKRYRAVAESGALVFWEADANGPMLALAGWTELTGQPEEDALGRGWECHIHPEDLPTIARHWANAIQHGTALDLEFRIQSKTGSWQWVRSRGAQVGEFRHPQWAGVLEDVHSRRQAQDELHWLAHHDSLTGLSNRVHFNQALNSSLSRASQSHQVALFCLDLDRFKQVNDTHGHPAGDALLGQVAQRLRQQLRSQDLVARLGGDEFAAIVAGPEMETLCPVLAQRIIAALSEPYILDTFSVQIGVSIGIAIASHRQTDPELLHHQADQALYAAKQQGRGGFILTLSSPA